MDRLALYIGGKTGVSGRGNDIRLECKGGGKESELEEFIEEIKGRPGFDVRRNIPSPKRIDGI